MLLMSWGGFSLREHSLAISGSHLEWEKHQLMCAVLQLSVVHIDWRLPNILGNDEVQRALVIDFERAHVQQRERKRWYRSESAITHSKSQRDGAVSTSQVVTHYTLPRVSLLTVDWRPLTPRRRSLAS